MLVILHKDIYLVFHAYEVASLLLFPCFIFRPEWQVVERIVAWTVLWGPLFTVTAPRYQRSRGCIGLVMSGIMKHCPLLHDRLVVKKLVSSNSYMYSHYRSLSTVSMLICHKVSKFSRNEEYFILPSS